MIRQGRQALSSNSHFGDEREERAPKSRADEEKICRIVFGGNDNDPSNFTYPMSFEGAASNA
jgi:hypothetical protein